MSDPMSKLANLYGVSKKEAVVLTLVSAAGWCYFAYSYLYESGLGVAVPRYAGY